MLRDDAVAIVKRRLGNRIGTLDAAIIDEMKLAQTIFEHDAFLPWFLLTELTTISTVASQERIAVPTNFLRETERGGFLIMDAENTWQQVLKDDYSALRAVNQSEGLPTHYALTGVNFRLFPTPDQAYVLNLIYFAQDAVLSTNVENQWLKWAPDLFIAQTAFQMAQNHFLDPNVLGVLAGQVREGKASLRRLDGARRATQHRYIMGGPDA